VGVSAALGLVTASADHSARIWDVNAGRLIAALNGHTDTVTAVAISTNLGVIATASADQTVRLWALDGHPLATLTGHTDAVTAVAFDPTDYSLASASADHTVRLWRIDLHSGAGGATGPTIDRIESTGVLTGHTDAVTALGFSPDGATLATASIDHTARLWNLATGQVIATLVGHSGPVTAVAFSPDGTSVATASADHTARLWYSIPTGHPSAVLTTGAAVSGAGTPDPVTAVTFGSQDSETLAVGNQGGSVATWRFNRIDDGSDTPAGVSMSSDDYNGAGGAIRYVAGDTALAYTTKHDTVTLLDRTGGAANLTLTGHSAPVNAFDINGRGDLVATASDDGTARLWDVSTARTTAVLTGHTGPVLCVAFSGDGRVVATGGADHTARLWNAVTGSLIAVLTGHTGPVYHVVFSPDSSRLVTTSDDHTAQVWNTATGHLVTTLTGFTGAPFQAVFGGFDTVSGDISTEDDFVTTGSDGSTARVFDAIDGHLVRTLSGHTGTVKAASFTDDGATIVTASLDHTLRLWDVATGAPIATLTGSTEELDAIAISPDNDYLAAGGLGPAVLIFNISGYLNPYATLCTQEGRRLSAAERSTYLADVASTFTVC
jgi:WD40 repeat protein